MKPRDPGDDERIAARRAQAITLRKAGATYRAIAATLTVDVRTAYEDVQAELMQLRELTEQEARDYRNLELERIDGLLLSLSSLITRPQGMPASLWKADAYAVDVARKLSESRRKLLGLDAPTKVAPVTPDGEKPYEGAIDLSKLSKETLLAIERDLAAQAQHA